MPHRLRVVLVESDEMVTQGLTTMLAPYGDRITLLTAGAAPPVAADLVLVDPSVRTTDERYWARVLDNVSGGRGLVIYTWAPSWGPAGLARLVAAGWPIQGWLSKTLSAEVLVAALESAQHAGLVVLGDAPFPDRRRHAAEHSPCTGNLTSRESEVVWMIAGGLSNQQIADRTFLSINSVKTYIRSSYRKMGVTNRTQAVLWSAHHERDVLPYHIVCRLGLASRGSAPAQPLRRPRLVGT